MALFLVTGPATEPVTLAEAKLHLRVDTDDENDLIRALIAAARQHVETFTRRALMTQTWDLKLDGFPCEGVIELPFPPVSAVSSIAYLDTSNVSQTWNSSNYLTDLPTGPKAQKARITPAYAVSWPSTYGVMNAVTVRFVAGYGTNPELVPAMLRVCIKEHARAHYETWRSAEERQAILDWVDRSAWPFRVF